MTKAKRNKELLLEEIVRVMANARLDHGLPYNDHTNKNRSVAERLLEWFDTHRAPAR